MNYAAVIFDCDGVLVDSEPIYSSVLAGLCAAAGWPLSVADCTSLFRGMAITHCMRLIEHHLGRSLPTGFAGAYQQRAMDRFAAELRPVAGVRQVVQALSCPCAVASSSAHRELDASLRAVGLFELFGGHVYSFEEVAQPKPAPDLYLYAANWLGVEPARCAVIEDSVTGVTAGVAAGMTVYGYAAASDAPPLAAAGAIVFQHMFELPPLLVSAC